MALEEVWTSRRDCPLTLTHALLFRINRQRADLQPRRLVLKRFEKVSLRGNKMSSAKNPYRQSTQPLCPHRDAPCATCLPDKNSSHFDVLCGCRPGNAGFQLTNISVWQLGGEDPSSSLVVTLPRKSAQPLVTCLKFYSPSCSFLL